MIKVLVSDPIADKGIELLETSGLEVIFSPNISKSELELLVQDIMVFHQELPIYQL